MWWLCCLHLILKLWFSQHFEFVCNQKINTIKNPICDVSYLQYLMFKLE